MTIKEGVKIVLEIIFKPIIALTLGIAIFDLAKTVLEQEVYFKSYSKNSKVETKMINALYLISGISLLLISLSVFILQKKINTFTV